MTKHTELGGSFTLPGTSMTVNRMGYGAMQLAGPHVFGPPRDTNEAVAVLREAVESGVNQIDTSGYYGSRVTIRSSSGRSSLSGELADREGRVRHRERTLSTIHARALSIIASQMPFDLRMSSTVSRIAP